MTPVVLLAVFCACMTVLAAVRLAIVDRREPTDVGSTAVAAGVTLFVLAWLGFQQRSGSVSSDRRLPPLE
ncbi:hypothetical protein [Natrialbaceae archaeon AArc-T1-2]|uniref:hypothetical protein n=1 Tax=Natrialbaceae archaeon AArc-T1-2 TaxID=3053904 RepID=UPI00255B2D69|nr:hypothetical protein [Natrialbaceae archaeon AArc-T1-2]WIV68137.1 hypothetical protein QQ977_05255 [Natrialbaceae archaeon AArc-T1-2]